MTLTWLCPSCGARNTLDAGGSRPLARSAACRACSRDLALSGGGRSADPGPLTRCVICGDDKMYVQKDFDQRLGCAIVALGAALVPWTYGLSLALCALVDFVLYRLLPQITVCYICRTRYRGTPANADYRPYDLMTAQTWEARALNWRSANDRSADP